MVSDKQKRQLLQAAVASVTVLSLSQAAVYADWTVEEKTIADLEAAYSGGVVTATNVVNQYLARINQYDFNAVKGVNGVASINPNVLADAAAVDALIAGGATTAQYPLLGVPVIVKDSYDAVGMPTTNGVSVLNGVGTPGSTTLMPQQDAFSVARLKAAGAIIIGKANMSTMAYSFNGIDNAHGVVYNPYNPVRQPGGSSSGTGASIASNFAMLGMGGETGGSIRIPSNANGLVGLKTSVGLIDPGGTWPLTPSRDVVGPLAKSVTDVAYAMNALVATSSTNLFNDTPMYPDAPPGTQRPTNYLDSLNASALQGKVLAVPKSMVSGQPGTKYEGNVSPIVQAAFDQALTDLKAQGATIVYVDIPASTKYYNTIGRSSRPTTDGFGYDYPTTVVMDNNNPNPPTPRNAPDNTWSSYAAAYYYETLIESYNDPNIKNLRDFANALSAGASAGAGDPNSTLGGAAGNIASLATIWEAGNAKGFGDANNDGILDNPDAHRALKAFSDLRKNEYEAFMTTPSLVDDPSTPTVDESTLSIDAFVAPTYGTVMPYVSAGLRPPGTPADPYTISNGASLLGRFEANILGNAAISLPMGYAPDGTPMGIQFFNEFNGEAELIGFAYDYEQATNWRMAPDLTWTTVPEPATIGILMIGGLSLGLRRRRETCSA